MFPRFLSTLRWLLWKLRGSPVQTVLQKLRSFLGPEVLQLQTHDKYFPGYDLASVNLALNSFLDDCCSRSERTGVYGMMSMRHLFDTLAFNPRLLPAAPTYQRVPVDVAQEASFVTNGLVLCALKGSAPGPAPRKGVPEPEKIAILLATAVSRQGYWDGMDTRNVQTQQVVVSIACRSRELADRFFTELDQRRQRLSVYRGKVIDPVVGPGGVHTIGFRMLQKVEAEDLVLPEPVRRLIHGSILGFYEHQGTLLDLGIDLKRGILLHGPPGTGKTSISLYLARQLPHFTICFVSGERLLYPRELCRMARYLQPAMIVFEDIDLVAQERHANGLATVLGELMNQIDGCEPTDQVLFLMNTNSLERLEHAVKNRPGRVDQIIEIPLPDRQDRARLLTYFLKSVRCAEPREKVLDATEGATPAMLKEIVKRAVVGAIAHNGERRTEGSLTLTEADLLLATEQVRALRDPEVVPGTLGFREKGRG
jgi:hypothetical protein